MRKSLLILVLGWAMISGAAEIKVAAAADLNFALRDLAAEFQAQTGNKVIPTLGSSGNLYSQLQNGAPFDVFMSADAEYPRRLADAGLAISDTLFKYAEGRIVIWVPESQKFDVGKLRDKVLLEPSVIKIAIANPKHAPYGRAAESALKKLGIYDQIAGKLVLGENISQAAQFVETGHAQAGIIALSLVLAPSMVGKGQYWEIPADSYPPLEQAAIVVKSSKQTVAARQFIEFLKSPAARQIFRRYGFQSPNK